MDIGAFESSGFTIAVISGSGQSANINEPFANPLVATVTANNTNEPVAGGQVTFTVPVSGASASLSVNPATIAANGQASTTPTANATPGNYTVTATARGVTNTASFSLTNLSAASLVVNTTSDSANPGPGLNTLRMAIAYANTFASGTPTITFDPTVFNTALTITLTGQLDLTDTSVAAETITGPAAGVIVSGGGTNRVFQVDSGVTASISGLTITDGSTSGSGGGLYNDGGIVTLTDCAISGNSAGADGGGITNTGALTLSGTTSLTSNNASIGGGMYNSGNLTVTTSGVSLTGTLTNAGSIVVDSGVTVYPGEHDLGASIINQAGATFDLQGTANLSDAYTDGIVYYGGTFTNAGTLEKSTGAGTATLAYALSNTGTVEVKSSTLYESGTFSNFSGTTLTGGTYFVSGTGQFEFAGANIVTNAATIVLDGTSSEIINTSSGNALAGLTTNAAGGQFTVQDGGSFTTSGALSNAGGITVSGGSTLTISGAFTQSGGSTILAGGTLTSTTSTVTSPAACWAGRGP